MIKMFSKFKLTKIFIITIIVISLVFSTSFVFIYLSPDQNHVSPNQQQLIQDAIHSEHYNEHETLKIVCSKQNTTRSLFNKFVFIVIDAFRSDFVKSLAKDEIKVKYNFKMPFIENLLKERKGLSVISRAQTPTVTMPKLKTILSGSLSNFIDILFNLNVAEFGTDNLIRQALIKRKRIIFYGDDTWLQMFNRSSFIRSNETLSLFARDYTSVDTNVTENLLPELNKTNEWDILILHYLGVDHIGHSYGGIDSKLLPDKLIEMDNVIKTIYKNLKKLDENYLIFITGDHGMTDYGNHGGSTIEETNTAFLMFTTDIKHQTDDDNSLIIIQQNDIVNIISFYFNFNIPNKSKGKLDLKLINKFGKLNNSNFESTKLCHLFKNSLQLQRMEGIASFKFLDYYLKAIEAHYKLINSNYRNEKLIKIAEQNYDHYLNIIQKSLLDVKNEIQSQTTLIISIFFQIIILIILIIYQINLKSFILKEIFSLSSINKFSLISIGSILLNIFLLGSTSFIEMEHYFIVYITKTLILVHGILVFRNQDLSINQFLNYAKILLCLMISSNWISFINTLSSFKSSTSQQMILFSFIFISLLIIYHYLSLHIESKIEKICLILILFSIFIYKYDSNQDSKLIYFFQDYMKARFAYVLIFIYLIISFMQNYSDKKINQKETSYKRKDKYNISTSFWIFLISLLIKSNNLPLIPIQLFIENQLNTICLNESKEKPMNSCSIIFRIIIYIYLGMCSFVSLGNTNSLSTLDVSAGFTALNSYNLPLVSIQMICSIYSTLVFWSIRLIDRFDYLKYCHKKWYSILLFILTIRLIFLIYFQIIAYFLINHLFIWSVITPKLLYEFALTILFELIIIYAIV